MIEIIRKGTKKIITCKKCGCYFSYEDEDIKNVFQNDYVLGYQPQKYFINCPQCNYEIILSSER